MPELQPHSDPHPAVLGAASRQIVPRQTDVVLVSMPWTVFRAPSIQIGLIEAILNSAGHDTRGLHFYVDFVNLLAQRVPGQRVSLDRLESFGEIFGEWTFAIPPFRANSAEDDAEFRRSQSAMHGEGMVEMAFRVRKMVPEFLRSCVDQVLAWEPRVVGFTTTFQQNVPSLILAQMLKAERPDLKIVFGGANCEGSMGAGLHHSFPWLDVVVRGEADGIVDRLFGELLEGGSVSRQPGLCIRQADGGSDICSDTAIDDREGLGDKNLVAISGLEAGTATVRTKDLNGDGPVSMDSLPLPVYSDYFDRLAEGPLAGKAEQIWLPYESARGCWWAVKKVCTFCAANAQYLSFRSKSPEGVLSDVRELSTRYDSKRVWFVDNIMEERYLREMFPHMSETPVPMFVETRAHVSKDHLRVMRDAGVVMVQLGVESFSSPVLKLIDKGTTAIQNIRMIKWCAELGVQAFYNVIYGFPGEDPEEYLRMADAVRSLTHLEPPNNPVRLRLDRFSPYHRNPDDYGIEVLGPYASRRFVYDLPIEEIAEIDYFFAFRHKDDRDPDAYACEFLDACRDWSKVWRQNFGALSYHRTAQGLRVYDRRSNLDNRIYDLGSAEAEIYLAADAGGPPSWIRKSLSPEHRQRLTTEAVAEILARMTERRLMFEEDGNFLALAVAGNERLLAHHKSMGELPIERLAALGDGAERADA